MKTAKQLAGDLGLIRKRTFCSNPHELKHQRSLVQQFSYLIIIDFESTCWKDRRNYNQEIIEFPAVLMNTSSGEIESEYHTYCLPEENPRLSSFCTELTGITQEQVESGIPLFLCLKKFSRWLKQLETDKNITYHSSDDPRKLLCTFVTWSDWDLGICLQQECRRKQLVKPDVLSCWMDLRATYRKFYQRIPKGLEGALKDLGIRFEGRQHSGLDDARNTAFLAWRMIRDGCVMKITKGSPLLNSKRDVMANWRTEVTPVFPLGNNRTCNFAPLDRGNSSCISGLLTEAPEQLSDIMQTTALIDNQLWFKEDSRSLTDQETSTEICESQACSKNVDAVGHHSSERFVKSPKSILRQFTQRRKTLGVLRNALVTEKQSSLAQYMKTSCSGCQLHLSSENRLDKSKNTTTFRGSIEQTAEVRNDSFKTRTVANLPLKINGMQSHAEMSNVMGVTLGSSWKTFTSNNNSSSHKQPAEKELCKSPQITKVLKGPFQTRLKSIENIHVSNSKITPPLCNCGKRTRRKTVLSLGPNQGRRYYSCCKRQKRRQSRLRDITNCQWGCNFFKWESLVLQDFRTPNSSNGTVVISNGGNSGI